MVTEPSGPADLMAVATAFWRSRMLAVAVELDIFSLLARQPATLADLCRRLGLHPRPTEALLNGLCAMGILDHDASGYRNGATADTWLDRAKPGYAGGLFAVAGWQFPLWTRLRDLLETGDPQGDHAELGFCPDELALRRFAEAVDAGSAPCGPALAATRGLDWSAATHVVDLGGSRGTVLAGILRAHPHLRGTSFDLPAVRPLFDEHAARLGVADRMRFHAGDFFADELPDADVYLLGHLLSEWDDERCAHLVTRAAAALPPGGRLVVYDALIDPGRPLTSQNWPRHLNTQLISPGGTVNTTGECAGWLAAAGLTGVQVHALVDAESVVLGTKPVD